MYRNQKKIIIVGVAAVVVLCCFGVGTWAIINSSYQTTKDDEVSSKLHGATAYLGDNGAFQPNNMSINDWLIYNMPKTILYETNGDTTSYWYYSDSDVLIATSTETSDSLSKFSIKTAGEEVIDLLNSEYERSNTSLYFKNEHDWYTTNPSTSVSIDYKGDASYEGSVNQNNNEFTLSFNFSSNSENQNSSSFITTITSNADSDVWSRSKTIDRDISTGEITSIEYVYSSTLLTNDLNISYIPLASDDLTYYSVSYTYGNATISTQNQLLNYLLTDSSDFSTSNLTTKDYLMFIPDFS